MKGIVNEKLLKKLFEIHIVEDNQACITAANNPVMSDLKQHIDLKYQFQVDNVREGKANLQYFPTGEMVADFLTKHFMSQKFGKLVKRFGMMQCVNWTFARMEHCVGSDQ